MTDSDIAKVGEYARSVFKGGTYSDHGPLHWRNVEDCALLIAPSVGADVVVCRLFSVLHDCCRLDDGSDFDHGPRAGQLIRKLSGSLIRLEPHREELLFRAVTEHTCGNVTSEPTVGTCWDADRLDLGRVGIIPTSDLMSTKAGKEIADLGSKRLYIEKLTPMLKRCDPRGPGGESRAP
jgi:uncharacterized protein